MWGDDAVAAMRCVTERPETARLLVLRRRRDEVKRAWEEAHARSIGGLNLNVFDANASIRLFVLHRLLVALSSLLLDNLLQGALGMFGDHGGDLDGGGGETCADVCKTVWKQPRGPRVGEGQKRTPRADGRGSSIFRDETGEESS